MAKPSIIRAKGKMYQIPNNSIIRAVTIGEKALIKLEEKKYSMYPRPLRLLDVNLATRDITGAIEPELKIWYRTKKRIRIDMDGASEKTSKDKRLAVQVTVIHCFSPILSLMAPPAKTPIIPNAPPTP